MKYKELIIHYLDGRCDFYQNATVYFMEDFLTVVCEGKTKMIKNAVIKKIMGK